MTPPILSPRLRLIPLTPTHLELLLEANLSAVEAALHCHIPRGIALDQMPLQRRLTQLRDDPSLQPWLLRAIVENSSHAMIGHIGFHSAPRPSDLAHIAPDGIELGYSVYAPFRRRGFAREAALALMHWSFDQHDQKCFVLSVSPTNIASTALARSLNFTAVGSHIDEEDGLELEYLRRFDIWPSDWAPPGSAA